MHVFNNDFHGIGKRTRDELIQCSMSLNRFNRKPCKFTAVSSTNIKYTSNNILMTLDFTREVAGLIANAVKIAGDLTLRFGKGNVDLHDAPFTSKLAKFAVQFGINLCSEWSYLDMCPILIWELQNYLITTVDTRANSRMYIWHQLFVSLYVCVGNCGYTTCFITIIHIKFAKKYVRFCCIHSYSKILV